MTVKHLCSERYEPRIALSMPRRLKRKTSSCGFAHLIAELDSEDIANELLEDIAGAQYDALKKSAKKELGKVYLRENLIERVFCGLRNWEEITKKVGGE